jgi:hypothetical protein
MTYEDFENITTVEDLNIMSNKTSHPTWATNAEIDFIFRMIEGKIKKEVLDNRIPYDKLMTYMDGLYKRKKFDTINKDVVFKVCYFLRNKLKDNSIKRKSEWTEIKKQIRELVM